MCCSRSVNAASMPVCPVFCPVEHAVYGNTLLRSPKAHVPLCADVMSATNLRGAAYYSRITTGEVGKQAPSFACSHDIVFGGSFGVRLQDDTKGSPAAKQPQHQSGVVGDVPNQQLILQVRVPHPTPDPDPDRDGNPLPLCCLSDIWSRRIHA